MSLRWFVLHAITLLALEGRAAGQQDLATCEADLPVCTGEINDCCLRPFDPAGGRRAVLIPMDRCHQRVAAAGEQAPPAAGSPSWCADPSSSADDGMFEAYGLVYRLMQNRINVHWVVNPTKDPPRLTAAEPHRYGERDVDLWVLGAGVATPPVAGEPLAACTASCADPVRRIDPASMLPVADSYNRRQLPLRGGVFVIAPEDRARFDSFMRRTGEFAWLAGNPTYDFSAVDLYEVATGARLVYQDFRTSAPRYALGRGGVPVARRIDDPAPRVARLAGGAEIWLARARLSTPAAYPACKSEPFSPSDAVYCELTDRDVRGGALAAGDFQSAWLDGWNDTTPCGDADETAAVDAVRAFMTATAGRAAGSVVLMDGAIGVFESAACGQRQIAGAAGAGLVPSAEAPIESLVLRRPASLLMQWGDLPTRFAAGSVAARWRYAGGGALGYQPAHLGRAGTLVRLVTEDRSAIGNGTCSAHRSAPDCDVYDAGETADDHDAIAYLRHLDRADGGIALYAGGSKLAGADSHQRLLLDALLVLPAAGGRPPALRTREVSRSARIEASLGGRPAELLGSVEMATVPTRVTTFAGAADAASFRFPQSRGHLRAVRPGGGAFLFDAGDDAGTPAAAPAGCATPFRGTCRTVFTTTLEPEDGLAVRPPRVLLTTGNADLLAPLLGGELVQGEVRTLITRVLAGRLGGIDRSSPAVIEASPLIPASADRPTMIYAGAMDGMLHAICAEARGVCPAAGRELWAFVPRTQLPWLRLNAARVDGSPKVTDVFADFDPADGETRREWRTVLSFQTGGGDPGDPARAPAAFALDITDPARPVVLWERTTRAVRGAVEQGAGLGVAMGHARVNGATAGLTFLQTANGGTGAAGFWLGAVDTATGALVWEVKELYPPPRSPGSAPVPPSGVPGGAVAVGTDASGLVSRVLVPSLHGAVWQLAAATGENPLGAGVPLIQFTDDEHPVGASPGVYRHTGNGRLYAVAASGGYVDPLAPTWATAGRTQYVVSAAIDTSPARAPVSESAAADFAEDRGFVHVLGGDSPRPIAQAAMSDRVVARAGEP